MNFVYELDADTGQPVKTFVIRGASIFAKDSGGMSQPASSHSPAPRWFTRIPYCRRPSAETLPALPGDIRAYDVHTGKQRWSFHTIPHPGELGQLGRKRMAKKRGRK